MPMLGWLALGFMLGIWAALVVALLRHGKSQALVEHLRRDLGQLRAAFQSREFHNLLQRKETLEATLEALPDMVLVVDSDAHVAAANARAETMLGAKAGAALQAVRLPQVVKEAILACLHGRRMDAAQVDLGRAVEMNLPGGKRSLLPRVCPIRGPGDVVGGAVLILSDVTELSRLDALRLELVAIASHELRTPLTTLRMTLLLLQEGEARLGQREREILATALGGVEQLASTVDEFLDLTRIESGQLKLNRELLPVRSFLLRSAEVIRDACAEASVKLLVEIDESAPATVSGDAPRLEAVLRNLLTNAVKYTPSGGEVCLSACGAPSPGSLEIQVTDTGPGVPAEYRERIFEKFFQVEKAEDASGRSRRGSGVGLYLARQVVSAHGGELVCSPGPADQGARFTLRLPPSRQTA